MCCIIHRLGSFSLWRNWSVGGAFIHHRTNTRRHKKAEFCNSYRTMSVRISKFRRRFAGGLTGREHRCGGGALHLTRARGGQRETVLFVGLVSTKIPRHYLLLSAHLVSLTDIRLLAFSPIDGADLGTIRETNSTRFFQDRHEIGTRRGQDNDDFPFQLCFFRK